MARVFCVEDDSGIRELIVCALKSGGYDVEDFSDGKKFFRRLHQEQPDLILLDLMLPEEDGITILRRLKSESITANIPVIILSAKSTEIDKVMGLENGADDYITKPFGVMEMLSRVKAVLRRSNSEPKEKSHHLLEIAGLSIDVDRRRVLFQGREIVLTYKEFELLTYLCQNLDVAISRETLLQAVWGYSYEGESRTVDAHIKTLRQKLESAGCENFIQTVRGYGYKAVQKDG